MYVCMCVCEMAFVNACEGPFCMRVGMHSCMHAGTYARMHARTHACVSAWMHVGIGMEWAGMYLHVVYACVFKPI